MSTSPWTEEEHAALLSFRPHAGGWPAIAARCPGRTPRQCKIRFYSIMRRARALGHIPTLAEIPTHPHIRWEPWEDTLLYLLVRSFPRNVAVLMLTALTRHSHNACHQRVWFHGYEPEEFSD